MTAEPHQATSRTGSCASIESRLIFVVGHPRSGTTLLANILSRHTEIAATPETAYLTEFVHRISSADIKNFDRLQTQIKESRLRDLSLDYSKLREAFVANEEQSPRTLFATILSEYGSARNKRIVVEKTPLHLRHIDELLSWYPRAKIVWVVRDGRACLNSLRKVDWATDDLRTLSRQYNRNVAFGLYAERRFPEKIFRMKYEDLVANPQEALTSLHEFLGLPFEDRQLEPSATSDVIPKWELAWKANAATAVNTVSLSTWRTELSPAQQHNCTSAMHRALSALGYEIELVDDRHGWSERLNDYWQAIIHSAMGLWLQRTFYRYSRRARARFRSVFSTPVAR